MTTRRRDIDVLLAMSSPRRRRARFRFRGENCRRRPRCLAARLLTRVGEILDRLGGKVRMYRRLRGNAYRCNARRRVRTALM